MKKNFNSQSAFTLVELIVSSALIVAILGLLLTSVDQTRRVVSSTTSRVAQFQAARAAFDAMTRNLSQATLNTYWDMNTDPASGNPSGYRRQSDLHFISRRAAQKTTSESFFASTDDTTYPTHSIFFQAPIGMTSLVETGSTVQARQYRALSNMLSVVGYYIKWGDDTTLPKFITPTSDPEKNLVPRRFRYRLMEVVQPGEQMMVYNNINYTNLKYSDTGILLTKSPTPSPFTLPIDWVRVAIGKLPPPTELTTAFPTIKQQDNSRILTDNIVSLIILPKVSDKDRSAPNALNELTDDFQYDSRPMPAFESQALGLPQNSPLKNLATVLDAKQLKQLHQLPPILQVTMVAIDEPSAIKLHDYTKANSYAPPTWCKDMFKVVKNVADFQRELGDPSAPDTQSLISKVGNVDGKHPTPKMNYRVFTADVILRNSKWSK